MNYKKRGKKKECRRYSYHHPLPSHTMITLCKASENHPKKNATTPISNTPCTSTPQTRPRRSSWPPIRRLHIYTARYTRPSTRLRHGISRPTRRTAHSHAHTHRLDISQGPCSILPRLTRGSPLPPAAVCCPAQPRSYLSPLSKPPTTTTAGVGPARNMPARTHARRS